MAVRRTERTDCAQLLPGRGKVGDETSSGVGDADLLAALNGYQIVDCRELEASWRI